MTTEINQSLTLSLLLTIKSNKDPFVLRNRWYEQSQILTQLEKMLDSWYINLEWDWLILTEEWFNKVKMINTEMWNKWPNERISVESWSQIPKLADGELYIPQESEVDF